MTDKKYIVSVSFGKDSLAMLLMLIEKRYPLDEVVFYDTGKEFKAIYELRDKIKPILKKHNITLTEFEANPSFDYKMFEKPVHSRKTKTIHRYGYSWCGGVCRWGTADKLRVIEKHCRGHYEYVGLAADELARIQNKKAKGHKLYPLVDWGMTEKDCLDYCYAHGYFWNESGIELYSILDRVSCWCCRNKNLRELKGMYLHLPEYWERLKAIQSRLHEPMKGEGKSVFELEARFKAEISKAGGINQ